MDLFYPRDFPDNAKNNVISALVVARRTLEQSHAEWRLRSDDKRPDLLVQYIMSVFAAFAQQACAIGKAKGSSDWVVKECRKFLYWLADKSAREFDYSEYGLPFPCGNVNLYELNRPFQKMVESSKEWAKYEDDLLEVARRSSAVGMSADAPIGTIEAPRTSSPQDNKIERVVLLAEYKSATGQPSNRQIYTAKNSGIHKPEFYQWIKGTLPATSQTAINFERFLRERKPPIKKS